MDVNNYQDGFDEQVLSRLTIGDLAGGFGISRESLRHWERRGTLPRAVRTPGGHRRYGREHVAALTRLLGPPRQTFVETHR
jgi:predicted site-specific integrase-resolvase